MLKEAALSAASADPTTTPLQFLLGVMRDPKAPAELRVQVARAAAPLVHGKSKLALVEDSKGSASAVGRPDGFAVDIAEARGLRDIEHRLIVFLRKRYRPRENGGPLTAAELKEESELDAMLRKELEVYRVHRSDDEQAELDHLKAKYLDLQPDNTSEPHHFKTGVASTPNEEEHQRLGANHREHSGTYSPVDDHFLTEEKRNSK